jgi:hypothetical protein
MAMELALVISAKGPVLNRELQFRATSRTRTYQRRHCRQCCRVDKDIGAYIGATQSSGLSIRPMHEIGIFAKIRCSEDPTGTLVAEKVDGKHMA